MNDYRKKELRYFKCPHCEKRFYIKHNESSQWRRFMPPRFCPGCGHEIGVEDGCSIDVDNDDYCFRDHSRKV